MLTNRWAQKQAQQIMSGPITEMDRLGQKITDRDVQTALATKSIREQFGKPMVSHEVGHKQETPATPYRGSLDAPGNPYERETPALRRQREAIHAGKVKAQEWSKKEQAMAEYKAMQKRVGDEQRARQQQQQARTAQAQDPARRREIPANSWTGNQPVGVPATAGPSHEDFVAKRNQVEAQNALGTAEVPLKFKDLASPEQQEIRIAAISGVYGGKNTAMFQAARQKFLAMPRAQQAAIAKRFSGQA